MTAGHLILVSAPSGAGKTSLVRAALINDPRLAVSVSHTTRSKRSTEENGVNYHFVDQEAFQAMIEEDAFLEHAQVFEEYYGTSKAAVEEQRRQGKDVILEIDWQGAMQVRNQMPETIGVFILPPSKRTLAARLRSRGENTEDSITRRLAEAELEMAQAPNYDYIIVNDDFDVALQELQSIFCAIRLRSQTQIATNAVVRAILSEP